MAATDKYKITLGHRWVQVSRAKMYLFYATADGLHNTDDCHGRVTAFRDL